MILYSVNLRVCVYACACVCACVCVCVGGRPRGGAERGGGAV